MAIKGEWAYVFDMDVLATDSKFETPVLFSVVAGVLFAIADDTWSMLFATPAAANSVFASLNKDTSWP